MSIATVRTVILAQQNKLNASRISGDKRRVYEDSKTISKSTCERIEYELEDNQEHIEYILKHINELDNSKKGLLAKMFSSHLKSIEAQIEDEQTEINKTMEVINKLRNIQRSENCNEITEKRKLFEKTQRKIDKDLGERSRLKYMETL